MFLYASLVLQMVCAGLKSCVQLYSFTSSFRLRYVEIFYQENVAKYCERERKVILPYLSHDNIPTSLALFTFISKGRSETLTF